ncbi:MAG: cobyrinate a,c-diamide synthase [Gemmatimonas sp.]
MPARGLILAGTGTGSGKTMLTAALLRALRRAGRRVAAFKTGPDYIDPAHLARAAGVPAINLDSWAMAPGILHSLFGCLGRDTDVVIGEGVMGLFDGARGEPRDGSAPGSTAELAQRLGLPVVLVVDASGMGQSVAAVVRGFATHDPRITVAGVVINRVASDAHGRLLADAISTTVAGVPVLGVVPRLAALDVPSRHLGLFQAAEIDDLDRRFDIAADAISARIDLGHLEAIARTPADQDDVGPSLVPPLGQRIAVARDDAFAFAYPAVLDGWRAAGAEILPFSPLRDEAPDARSDAVYLPGGYPELHAGRLASAETFRTGLATAAQRGAFVFGECGGYMTLGSALRDAEGRTHRMAGLLPLSCDFAERKLHLGYRDARILVTSPLGAAGTLFAGHEFHYARVIDEGRGDALFAVTDTAGNRLDAAGRAHGRVAGSFIHIIAQR